jgi:uncharacterized protein (TIGR02246 family)
MTAESDVERDVRSLLEAWVRAYNELDADAYAALFSDDAVAFGTGVDEVRIGRQEIEEQARRDFAQAERLAARLGEVSIYGTGDVAWATVSNAMVEASVIGQDQRFPLRITAVLRRADGRWLIHHAHISTPMAAQDAGQSFPSPDN